MHQTIRKQLNLTYIKDFFIEIDLMYNVLHKFSVGNNLTPSPWGIKELGPVVYAFSPNCLKNWSKRMTGTQELNQAIHLDRETRGRWQNHIHILFV